MYSIMQLELSSMVPVPLNSRMKEQIEQYVSLKSLFS